MTVERGGCNNHSQKSGHRRVSKSDSKERKEKEKDSEKEGSHEIGNLISRQ